MSFVRKAACAYVYGLCDLSGLCLRIFLLDFFNVSVIRLTHYCALSSLFMYLKVCTKGYEGVNMISSINLVAGILHYFLLNHAYN